MNKPSADKPQAIWRRRGHCMVPANEEAEAMLRSIKDGKETVGSFWCVRSIQQLRLYWGGLMRILVDNSIFPTKKSASDATKIAAGHVEMSVLPDTGEVHLIPMHINFGSLVQPEFNEVMEHSIAVVCSRWLHGAEYDDVRNEVYAMLEPPEMRALGRRVRSMEECA
jgi:hypothetical protein